MTNFAALFKLEFKRFTRWWKLGILLLIMGVSYYSVCQGFKEFKKIEAESEKFKMCEALISKTLNNYNDYAQTGICAFFLPSPMISFFTNPPKTSELAGNCNFRARLDIDSSSKNGTVTHTDAPFKMRFSVLVLLLGSLGSLFIGLDSLRSTEYLRFLSANTSTNQTSMAIAISRFILIAVSFISIFLLMLAAAKFHNIPVRAADIPGMISYLVVTLILIVFFYLTGFLAGNFRGIGKGVTALLIIWVALVIVIPGILDSIIDDKAVQIPSPYELHENKLRELNNFERQSVEAYGKFNKNNMETERKIIEDYKQRKFKEIKAREEQFKQKIVKVIEDYNKFAIFCPTTFYNLATGEASSRGFSKYKEFYGYMQKLWDDFVNFWIYRVYYNDPKQMVNFIKSDENIFKSHGRQPEYFLAGVLVNSCYIIILFLGSAFLFKKTLARIKASKQDIADLGKLNINMKSGDLKIWLTQGHLYRDTLYNIIAGNRKAINKKGISGMVQINGTDIFSTGIREPFTYLCRPQHIPGEITVKELIEYYAGVQKASKEELNAILESPEIMPIIRKPFYQLEGSEKFYAMSALLQVKRKQVYLIDDLAAGYPARCAIRLSEQIVALQEVGAVVIFLTSTTDVPSCEKITGAYHDGMHWLYSVESRKASLKMEQQRQGEH